MMSKHREEIYSRTFSEGPYSLASAVRTQLQTKSLADEEHRMSQLFLFPAAGTSCCTDNSGFVSLSANYCSADDACKHYDGNKRAKLQVEKVKKLLETFSIDPNRVDFVQLSHVMPYPLRDALSK